MALFKSVDGVQVEMTPEEEAAFLAQQTFDSAPNPSVQINRALTVVQGLLTAFARERGYDSIEAAVTYDSPNEPDPTWAAEGHQCRLVRANVWAAWNDRIAAMAGGQPAPTEAEITTLMLPLLTWGQA